MWYIITAIMHTSVLSTHFHCFSFCFESFQFTLNIKQFINIFFLKRRSNCYFEFICRQIFDA